MEVTVKILCYFGNMTESQRRGLGAFGCYLFEAYDIVGLAVGHTVGNYTNPGCREPQRNLVGDVKTTGG
jgi:hypothetical protein